MGRVPHLLLTETWADSSIAVPDGTRMHLEKVLRMSSGAVTYTDGAGTLGHGVYSDGVVRRGDEIAGERSAPYVVVAVAPPHETARQRFLVEKLAELGVDRIDWLRTEHGANRFPPARKAAAWADAALEQSRGTWRVELGEATEPSRLGADGPVLVAHPGAPPVDVPHGSRVTVAIGPEAGFTDDEIARADGVTFGLGPRILRVETAAILAAGLVLRDSGRMAR